MYVYVCQGSNSQARGWICKLKVTAREEDILGPYVLAKSDATLAK